MITIKQRFLTTSLALACCGMTFAAWGAQPAPSAAVSPSGVPVRGPDNDRGCETEERDVSFDCGLRIRARSHRAPPPAKSTAPLDLSGTWVSVISEDWRWRMVVPPKGDYQSLPINDEAAKVADTWDPKDVGTCKPFGAPALMRNPTRARFEWVDDNTLRAQTDNGEQTRLFHFGPPPADLGARSRQGYSSASWHLSGLRVATHNLLPGYLRTNGVPYSENATVTEYYDRYSAFGEDWLTITTIVNDPQYLTREFVTSLDFKRQKDDSGWRPQPCTETGA